MSKKHATLPTRVAAVADNTQPLCVSQKDSKCDEGTSVIKDSNFRINVRVLFSVAISPQCTMG